MITQNFRLNALANQYAAALYNHITATSHGEYFMMDAGGEPVQVQITGGIQGIRQLIDSYALEAMKETYPNWETIGCAVLNQCLVGNMLTAYGLSTWQSMVSDMGATLAGNEGGFHA